jgi:transposase InsO family protein
MRGTIATILRQHGIEPAPERRKRTTWRQFLTTHWDVLAATDFFTVEVWTATGLTRCVVLFAIELATRRVHIAGITPEPDSAWVVQCSRQLTDVVDGFLLAATSVETVRLPPKPPNLNAFAERFVRTIKESCLDRLILVDDASLRKAIREFVIHYHEERNHQGLGKPAAFPSLRSDVNPQRPRRSSSASGWSLEVLPSPRGINAAQNPL